MGKPDPVATMLPGGWVLLGPVGVGYCERALRLLKRTAARDGIGAPPEVRALTSTLVSALGTSDAGSAEVPNEAPLSASSSLEMGPVSAGTAAEYLEITDRGVRDLCARGALSAERVAGRWVIDRADLRAYAARRLRSGDPHDPPRAATEH